MSNEAPGATGAGAVDSGAFDTLLAKGVRKRFTDPKACQQWGGHCWVEETLEKRLPSFLRGELTPLARICKHCGLKQRGVYQEPVLWEDVHE